MPTMLFEALKFFITSVGVGLINQKLFKGEQPSPPNFGDSITKHPLFPWVSAALIQKPSILVTPLVKSSRALTGALDKTGTIIWGTENQSKKDNKSLIDLSNLFWATIDTSLSFAIQKPKVVVFLVATGCVAFILLEPMLSNLQQARRLKSIERRLTQKIKEEHLIKAVSARLGKDVLLSEVVNEISNDESGGVELYDSENIKRNAILKAMARIKRR